MAARVILGAAPDGQRHIRCTGTCMLARVASFALHGIDAVPVDVEVDFSPGLPQFNVVGLPEGAARESRVRVVSAVRNAGFDLPPRRITVNLAPADIRKDRAAFELPLALGALAAAGQLPATAFQDTAFAGELALDGSVRAIRGALPFALAARSLGCRAIVLPAANAHEASLVEGISILPACGLRDVTAHCLGDHPLSPAVRHPLEHASFEPPADFSDVRGQDDVKDALEIAAAGGHNLLMCGPPGSGKSMLAARLPGLLPELDADESLEVAKIYSIIGQLHDGGLPARQRPFRAPHHTISSAGLVGGGPAARPGELTLAHRGVLFLDELPEFSRSVLEVLRQPLEEGNIRLARAATHITYPCDVMLVAAMNPCPCGNLGASGRVCICSAGAIERYRGRLSAAFLDRIDLRLNTRSPDVASLRQGAPPGKPSSHYRARVMDARRRQEHRFRNSPVRCNARMTLGQLHEHCLLDQASEQMLARALVKQALSARAHTRLLKVARTRADLEGRDRIALDDVLFALSLRSPEGVA